MIVSGNDLYFFHRYIVKNDFEPGLLFSDAPVPILHRLHPLETLRYVLDCYVLNTPMMGGIFID